MAETAGDNGPAGSAAASAPPGGAAGGDPEQLAKQVAERVYRLMLAEARLSRARGQQPPRRWWGERS